MTSDYSVYTDKKVNLKLTNGTEQTGTVEAGSPIGIVFKEKGSRTTQLIEADKIDTIEEVAPGPKKLKARTIPLVTEGKHREHLIERHGYPVSQVEPMTEAQAKAFHDTLDHTDLGHRHRPKTEAELAIEQAEADAEQDGE